MGTLRFILTVILVGYVFSLCHWDVEILDSLAWDIRNIREDTKDLYTQFLFWTLWVIVWDRK